MNKKIILLILAVVFIGCISTVEKGFGGSNQTNTSVVLSFGIVNANDHPLECVSVSQRNGGVGVTCNWVRFEKEVESGTYPRVDYSYGD